MSDNSKSGSDAVFASSDLKISRIDSPGNSDVIHQKQHLKAKTTDDITERAKSHEDGSSAEAELLSQSILRSVKFIKLNDLGLSDYKRVVRSFWNLRPSDKVDINATDDAGNTALWCAIDRGDDALVKNILKHRRKPCKAQFPELLHAISLGRLKSLEVLVENWRHNGWTPEDASLLLAEAARHGHASVVKILLDRGATNYAPNLKTWTALHFAAFNNNLEIVSKILEYSGGVDIEDRHGNTPLHFAALQGFETIIDYLLNKGAQVNASNKFKDTPLHYTTCSQTGRAIYRLLVAGADVDAKNETNETPLHFAARRHKSSTINIARKIFPARDVRSTFEPREEGKEEVNNFVFEAIKLLLQHGATIDSMAESGFTPLHLAARGGHEYAIDLLLSNGANVNAATSIGVTPLYLAAEGGHVPAIRLLLSSGAYVDAVTSIGTTPLHLAAQGGHLPFIHFLVSNGANVNAITGMGSTPLHFAANRGHMYVVEILLSNGANINAVTSIGSTPLHLAAQGGYEHIVDLLLSKGANSNLMDRSGFTPLDLARSGDHISAFALLELRMFEDSQKQTQQAAEISVTGVKEDVETGVMKRAAGDIEAVLDPLARWVRNRKMDLGAGTMNKSREEGEKKSGGNDTTSLTADGKKGPERQLESKATNQTESFAQRASTVRIIEEWRVSQLSRRRERAKGAYANCRQGKIKYEPAATKPIACLNSGRDCAVLIGRHNTECHDKAEGDSKGECAIIEGDTVPECEIQHEGSKFSFIAETENNELSPARWTLPSDKPGVEIKAADLNSNRARIVENSPFEFSNDLWAQPVADTKMGPKTVIKWRRSISPGDRQVCEDLLQDAFPVQRFGASPPTESYDTEDGQLQTLTCPSGVKDALPAIGVSIRDEQAVPKPLEMPIISSNPGFQRSFCPLPWKDMRDVRETLKIHVFPLFHSMALTATLFFPVYLLVNVMENRSFREWHKPTDLWLRFLLNAFVYTTSDVLFCAYLSNEDEIEAVELPLWDWLQIWSWKFAWARRRLPRQVDADSWRVFWICECGDRLSTIVSSAQFTELDYYLNRPTDANSDAADADLGAAGSVGNSNFISSATLNPPLPVHLPRSRRSSSQSDGTTPALSSPGSESSASSVSLTGGSDRKFLELSVKASSYDSRLMELDLSRSYTSTALFTKISEAYYKVRKNESGTFFKAVDCLAGFWYKYIQKNKHRRLLFKEAKRIEFVRMQIERPNYAYPWDHPRPSIPPKDVLDKGLYCSTVRDLEEDGLPMPSDVFMHCFYDPDNHSGGKWLKRIPKKLNESLFEGTDDHAWGIEIIDAPNWVLIISFSLIWYFLTLAGFIVYSCLRRDVSGGAGLGQFSVASMTFCWSLLLARYLQEERQGV